MEQSKNYNFNLPSKNDETSADIDLISENFRTVDDIVKQVQDDVSKIPTNLVNGSAYGSVRGINAKEEDSEYTIGQNAVAVGFNTVASGDYSHAEGSGTTASGDISHAEGRITIASGTASHAEGNSCTTASGTTSHAEGSGTTASGDVSHAEGGGTIASGEVSHAEGICAIASGRCQHAQGKFNIEDTNNRYAHIVGNGEDSENRSNAHTLDWNGNAWFAGDVLVGGTSQDDENATKLSSVAAELDTKVSLNNGTIQGAVDWNTITKTGCYKIQNCTMTEDYNAPPNEYVYGVLQVLNSENETGEYRVTQIYIPRSPQRYSLWIRTNNSTTGYNNWTDWFPFNNAFQLYTKFSTKADIETGSCTLSSSNGTVSNATYSVVGNMVTLNFNIAPTGAGNVVVSGLPFTAAKNQSGFASSTATYNITANQTSVSINSTSGTAEYCTVTYLK